MIFPVVVALVALVLDPSAVALYFVGNIVCVVVVLRFADDVLVVDLDVV